MDNNVSDEHRKFIKEHWNEMNEWTITDYKGDEYKFISEEGGGPRRWSEYMTVVTQVPDGRFIQWVYDRGLTEYQDNEFERIDGYVVPETRYVTITEYV